MAQRAADAAAYPFIWYGRGGCIGNSPVVDAKYRPCIWLGRGSYIARNVQ
ncbi:MAG: hypothetical protein ACLTC4_06640 [Hungatella hathewayi]|nr:hypothetical protein [Hungatella hathewayi]MBS4986325.1 hypothetical protein [Hungatella hathewayi]